MFQAPSSATLDFNGLAQTIARTHHELAAQATRAVNVSLTLRNWLIGQHIAEYELAGSDRAQYGDRLLLRLAQQLRTLGVPGCNSRELYRHRDVFRCYPQILGTLSPKFAPLLASTPLMARMATTAPAPSSLEEQLFSRLSYSHLALLSELGYPEQRRFYETEAVCGHWSVREFGVVRYLKEALSAYAEEDVQGTPGEPEGRDSGAAGSQSAAGGADLPCPSWCAPAGADGELCGPHGNRARRHVGAGSRLSLGLLRQGQLRTAQDLAGQVRDGCRSNLVKGF